VPELPPVCILAGGLGTRLGEVVKDTPKPLLEVAGQPFLAHQLRLLREHGFRDVVLCVGYLGERIEEEIGDGARYGMSIAYAYDPPKLAGTAGAVRAALPLLGEEFLVLYGDTYLRIDYADVARAFRASGCPALMTVLQNKGRWDVSNVLLDGDRVARYDKRDPTPDMEWIDYGLGALRAEVVADPDGPDDLAEVYAALSAEGRLAAYRATERFYEIGTPEALAETERFLLESAG
jgi:NDP-sugar pyrophosphorylase family protein